MSSFSNNEQAATIRIVKEKVTLLASGDHQAMVCGYDIGLSIVDSGTRCLLHVVDIN